MKSKRSILLLSIVSLVNLIPLLFSSAAMNVNKVDLYLFYDKLRYPENIAYDISEFCSITILVYTIWSLIPIREYKRYAFCFLVISFFGLPAYFLFYSQYVTLFFIPVLALMLYLTMKKNENEKRVNVR